MKRLVYFITLLSVIVGALCVPLTEFSLAKQEECSKAGSPFEHAEIYESICKCLKVGNHKNGIDMDYIWQCSDDYT
ncbi:hypothetical protein GE061_008866 [Apolygus lucorum]|uniref:Uncharacterized protein n=1 Tax=Apolygus lucorum TaxID=248454 RepID=A0A6A4KI23_APOLU|nr:hypothetical protein GE061_008866 [Apolygus lucorum]